MKSDLKRLMCIGRGILIILKKRYYIWRLLAAPFIWLFWFMIALIRGPEYVTALDNNRG